MYALNRDSSVTQSGHAVDYGAPGMCHVVRV